MKSGHPLGAPSQHRQASRKGKRTWRKNIDIDDVETGLEGLRAEERVTGSLLQHKQNGDLFQVDITGDNSVRRSLPRFSRSQLTSTKILSERSAVPAVYSRVTSKDERKTLNAKEKSRLLRIGKRPLRGPFGSIMDPSEYRSGSSILDVSEAVKGSGNHDPWQELPDKRREQDGFEPPEKPKVQAPKLPNPRDIIELTAIVEPHQGTSYNPPASAHQELLMKAIQKEEEKERRAENSEAMQTKIDDGAMIQDSAETWAGMKVAEVLEDDAEADIEPVVPAKKMPERKTKSQRSKEAKHAAEKRKLAQIAVHKRMLERINTVKHLRRATERTQEEHMQAHARRLYLRRAKLKSGLGGQKLGKHKVPEGEIDVQLGEELSESLRELKPEGNLFRDRFLSLQQRALVEPRKPVLPKKRTGRFKEFEKHAWKRFV